MARAVTESPGKRVVAASLDQADELSTGIAALKKLIQDVGPEPGDRNEAETRFQIIDRLLVECLGCPRLQVHVETPQGREYTDYEIGSPALAIWEAKREGKPFTIPLKAKSRMVQSLVSLAKACPQVEEALKQANDYCLSRGCEIAVVTNGHQLVAFLPSDFSSGFHGNGFVVLSLAHLEEVFGRVWQLLSFPALTNGALIDFLRRSITSRAPEKLSAFIPNYPQFKERTALQSSLRTIADLILLDLEKQAEIEKNFYEECYVESGGLSQNSTVSKSILAARYASLFDGSEEGPELAPVKPKRGKDTFTPDLLAEAIAGRPIILLGDVGVGKTSFIKHLRHVSAYDEFQRAIYVYVDLGFEGALSKSLRELVLRTVEDTLEEEYGIDVAEDAFVRRVYKKQLSRFEKSVHGRLKETDPASYLKSEIEFLQVLMEDKAEHLKRCIQHLSSERRKQVILAIDNADQRGSAVQQEAFLIAQNVASTWKAAVFVAMRPGTYHTSKRAGALSGYQNRVFTVSPPRIDLVLAKRLRFAVEIAQGKRELEQLQNVSLNLSSIVSIINVLMPSIEQSEDLQIFLENITAGNVRDVIELLVDVIGSPNIDTEAVIRGLSDRGRFFIPLHDFWKVALKGDYNFFDPSRVKAVNVFDAHSNDRSEHFLAPLMLGFLSTEGSHRAAEGFVPADTLIAEIQSLGFGLGSCRAAIRRLVNDKLIETSYRISFEEDEFGLFGEMPERVRVNSAGGYYLNRWMGTFPYLDAVAVDTPIFDIDLREQLRMNVTSLALADRYDRALRLKNYLSEIWNELGLRVDYFDWHDTCQSQAWTFDRARGAIARRGSPA